MYAVTLISARVPPAHRPRFPHHAERGVPGQVTSRSPLQGLQSRTSRSRCQAGYRFWPAATTELRVLPVSSYSHPHRPVLVVVLAVRLRSSSSPALVSCLQPRLQPPRPSRLLVQHPSPSSMIPSVRRLHPPSPPYRLSLPSTSSSPHLLPHSAACSLNTHKLSI